MAKKKAPGKENGFDRLARLIKEEGEDIRTELRGEMREGFASIERKMDERFTAVQMPEIIADLKAMIPNLLPEERTEMSRKVDKFNGSTHAALSRGLGDDLRAQAGMGFRVRTGQDAFNRTRALTRSPTNPGANPADNYYPRCPRRKAAAAKATRHYHPNTTRSARGQDQENGIRCFSEPIQPLSSHFSLS
jgi:hypothetical protein